MDTQPGLDEVLNRLRAYRDAANLSYSALARRAALSRAALLGMDRPDWGPASATIRAVEALIPEGWEPGHALPPNPEQVGAAAAAAASTSTEEVAR